jgi:hypothetical protein
LLLFVQIYAVSITIRIVVRYFSVALRILLTTTVNGFFNKKLTKKLFLYVQLGFMLIALIWKFDFSPFMVLIIAILNDGNLCITETSNA